MSRKIYYIFYATVFFAWRFPAIDDHRRLRVIRTLRVYEPFDNAKFGRDGQRIAEKRMSRLD